MARHSVPDPAPRAEVPTNTLIVFSKGAGMRDFETEYGVRQAFGTNVYAWNGSGVDYLGHVNVFWSVVRDQLAETLKGDDDLLAAQVVKDGRRFVLKPWGNGIEVQRAYEATEAQLAEADAPYADDAAPF